MPVTSARKELVANRIKFAESEDASVLTRNPRADVDERVSLFDVESDASTVASELISLFGPSRSVYEITHKGKQYEREIGDTITITHDGVGLSAALGIIFDIQENSEDLSTRVKVFV